MSPAETQTPATSHQTMASNIINSTVAAVLNVTNNIEREMDITTTHAQIETTSTTTTVETMTEYIDPNLQAYLYCSAGWQVAIALITVGFAIVIALYGPVVFGSVNLTRGMEVATKFLEFILPIKYEGKPAEEKMNLYTKEQFDSKIRRFSCILGLTMSGFAFFEFITGCVGRSAFEFDVESDGKFGEVHPGKAGAHAALCVLMGITTFCLMCAALMLFNKGFLREMMLVYAIRNFIVCLIFTASWSKYYGFEPMNEFSSAMDNVKNSMNEAKEKLIN